MLVYLPCFHHEVHIEKLGNVLEWARGYRDDVCEFPWFQSAEMIALAQQRRRVYRGRHDRLHFGQTYIDIPFKLAGVPAMRNDTGIAP